VDGDGNWGGLKVGWGGGRWVSGWISVGLGSGVRFFLCGGGKAGRNWFATLGVYLFSVSDRFGLSR
jgi:hypothetical protein